MTVAGTSWLEAFSNSKVDVLIVLGVIASLKVAVTLVVAVTVSKAGVTESPPDKVPVLGLKVLPGE